MIAVILHWLGFIKSNYLGKEIILSPCAAGKILSDLQFC